MALAVLALLTYRGVSATDRLRDRVVLVGLRLAALAVLLFCLFRPTLVLKAAVPQQNFLGVLVDDSRSMSIADRDGQTRAAFVQQQLSGPNAKLLAALSQRFVVRFFSFASSSDRIASAANLKYGGTATRLGQALERARDELSGLPLAGLVMVSDGADTSDAAIDQTLASLKTRSIPVFTVGVGQERFAHDIQVTRVETPRAVLKGTALVVDVVLSQTGTAAKPCRPASATMGTWEHARGERCRPTANRRSYASLRPNPARVFAQSAYPERRTGDAEQRP
jgi:hypothetical protein